MVRSPGRSGRAARFDRLAPVADTSFPRPRFVSGGTRACIKWQRHPAAEDSAARSRSHR
jgi:hypothetical protein